MNLPGTPYPGNPSLSPQVRQRVEATYRQSLELAERGNRQEASLGCDFVLQLDPDYTPAQDLLARLESGEPIAKDAAQPDRRDEVEALFDEARIDPATVPPSTAAAAPGAESNDELADRIAALVGARRHDEALELVRGAGDRIAADPRLTALARAAEEQHEAAPYVERFVAAARDASRGGDEETARAQLEKVRALDPDHPALTEVASEPAGTPPAAGGEMGAAFADAGPPPTDDPFADLGGNEEGRRIDDLLGEGQAAFDRGDHQGAIDAWSRIFLIDIEHGEAARRIEEARRLKAEQERRVEEVFHDAEQALAGGDEAAAREGYERVLEAQPGHDEARRRIDRLDGDGLAAAIGEAASAVAVGDTGAAPAGASPPSADSEPLREEILVPPEPGQAQATVAGAAVPGRSLAVASEGRAGRRFLLIGSLVFVVVAAAAYLLWENRASIFPNAGETAAPVVEEDAITRATALHRSGRVAMAINQLRRLPPSAPEYPEAQALISQWEAESAPPPSPATEEETTVDPVVAGQQQLVETARTALADGNYLSAIAALEQAAEVAPLEEEAAALQRDIERRVAPVARLVDLVRGGDHERALPDLWRRLEVEPDDALVRHLIIEAYYRMGVRDLQRGDAAAAAGHLAEARELAPDDPLLDRHQRFAEAYAQRDKDLLYRIYVKHLPPR